MPRSMDATAAQEFSESFGMIGAGWWRQIAWAKQQGIPDALGMSTRDWVEHYVGGWARLAIEDRREAVLELIAAPDDGGLGLSQREAAEVLGVSKSTVQGDIEAVTSDHDASSPEHEESGSAVTSDHDARGDADILVTYMSGLADLPRSAKPHDLAASLNVPNRGAFAKRLMRVSRYLEAVANELREVS